MSARHEARDIATIDIARRAAAAGVEAIELLCLVIPVDGEQVAADLNARSLPGVHFVNQPFIPVEHVTPTRMGHVVFFVPKERAREISDFYTDRLQFRG